MVRILKFYLITIVLLGTAVFISTYFALGGKVADTNFLMSWAITLSMTGILLVMVFTPIQWLAAALKRPWIAYALSTLVGPLFFLANYIDAEEGLAFNMGTLSMHARDQWGFPLACFLLGITFTYFYQRWFYKKV